MMAFEFQYPEADWDAKVQYEVWYNPDTGQYERRNYSALPGTQPAPTTTQPRQSLSLNIPQMTGGTSQAQLEAMLAYQLAQAELERQRLYGYGPNDRPTLERQQIEAALSGYYGGRPTLGREGQEFGQLTSLANILQNPRSFVPALQLGAALGLRPNIKWPGMESILSNTPLSGQRDPFQMTFSRDQDLYSRDAGQGAVAGAGAGTPPFSRFVRGGQGGNMSPEAQRLYGQTADGRWVAFETPEQFFNAAGVKSFQEAWQKGLIENRNGEVSGQGIFNPEGWVPFSQYTPPAGGGGIFPGEGLATPEEQAARAARMGGAPPSVPYPSGEPTQYVSGFSGEGLAMPQEQVLRAARLGGSGAPPPTWYSRFEPTQYVSQAPQYSGGQAIPYPTLNPSQFGNPQTFNRLGGDDLSRIASLVEYQGQDPSNFFAEARRYFPQANVSTSTRYGV